MASFNYLDYISNLGGGSSPSGGGGGGQQFSYDLPQSGQFNWGDFINAYGQVAQANQLLQDNQEDMSVFLNRGNEESDKPKSYRPMNPFESIAAGANFLSEDLGVALGDIAHLPRFDADKGFTPENVVSFGANLPGMFLGGFPDTFATGAEILANSPIKEVERGSDQIENRKLTTSEKLADAGYIGATLLTSFFGPEGKALGGVGKGLGAIGRRAGLPFSKAVDDLADQALRGTVKKAAPIETAVVNSGGGSGAIKAAKIGDTALEVGASALTEGIEEAAQTGFEDVRFHKTDDGKTLDRMAQAGAWGALGGGLFSGAVGTVTTGRDIYKMSTQSDSVENAAGENSPHSTEPYRWQQLRQENTSGQQLPAMKRYYDEQAKSDNRLRADGSVTVTLSESNPNYLTNDFGVGVEEYIDAFGQNDNSAVGIARELTRGKVSSNEAVAEVSRAINDNTVVNNGVTTQYSTVHDAMNALREKYWGKHNGPRAALEKRPGAHYTGGYGRIVEFKPGRGFACAPHVAKIVGADHDSDTGALHFITKNKEGKDTLNLLGWMSDMIVSPENVPLTDFYYTNFNERFDVEKWRGALKRAFRPFSIKKRVEDGQGSHEVGYVNYYQKEMKRAVESGKNEQIADVLRQLNNDLKNLYDIAQKDPSVLSEGTDIKKTPGPRRAFERLLQVDSKDMLKTLEADHKAIKIEQYEATIGNLIQQDESIPSNVKDKFSFDKKTGAFYLHGTLDGNGRVVSVMEDIGEALYTLVTTANQPFRQHGQLNLNFAKRQGAYTNFADRLNKLNLDTDVIDVLIRCSFRIARTGTTPLQAVEGLINQKTISETFRRSGLDSSKVSTVDGFDSVLGIFADEYDKGNADYEYAQMIPTANGYQKNPSASKRTNISKAPKQEKVDKFCNVFGAVPIDEIFDASIMPSDLVGMSLNSVLTEYANNPTRFSRIFANAEDVGLQDIFDMMIKAKNGEKPKISRSIKTLFRDVKGIQNIKNRMKADEKGVMRLDRNDYAAVISYVNNFVELLTPKMTERLGITDPIRFVEETRVGQLLFHQDYQVRLNTWFAMLTRAKFGDLHDLLHNAYNFNEKDAKIAKENALIELQKIANTPGIQGLIAKELIANNGNSNLYDVFTSLEGGFDNKESQFNQAYNPPEGWDLIVDMMMDSNDEFSVSSISRRYRDSQQSLAQYDKALVQESIDSVNNISEAVRLGKIDSRMVEAAIDTAIKAARIDVNIDSIVLSVYNSLGSGISHTEKGVNEAAASSFYEAMELIENGNPLSLIERVTACKSGVVSLDNFGTNKKLLLAFLGGEFDDYIRVYNNQCRTKCITRDWLFSQVSPRYDSSVGPQYDDWMALFKKCPQLESIIADSVTQPLVVNGEGDATVGKTGSLYDSVMAYQDMFQTASTDKSQTNEKVGLWQIDYGLHEVELTLLGDGRYVRNMIHCMRDMGSPENASIESIRSQFLSLHTQFVRAHYYDAQRMACDFTGAKADSNYSIETDTYFKSIDQRFFNEISDTVDSLCELMRRSDIEDAAMKKSMQIAVEGSNRQALYEHTFNSVCEQTGYADENGVGIATRFEPKYSGEASNAAVRLAAIRLNASVVLERIKEIYSITVGRTPNENAPLSLASIERDQFSGIDENTMTNYVKNLQADLYLLKNKGKKPEERVPLTSYEYNVIVKEAELAYSKYAEENGIVSTRDLAEAVAEEVNRSMSEDIGFSIDQDRLDDLVIEMPNIPCLLFSDIERTYTEKGARELLARIESYKTTMGSASALGEYSSVEDIKEKVYDDNNKISNAGAQQLIKRVNGFIIDQALRNLNRELGAEFNSNAALEAARYEESFREMQQKVRDKLASTPNPLDHSGEGSLIARDLSFITEAEKGARYNQGFPVPDFTKKANQGCATHYTLATAGGPVPGSITRNGGSLKSTYSVGFLPRNRNGFIPPVPKTIDQLRALVAKDPTARQWKYVKSGTWSANPDEKNSFQVGTIGGLLSEYDNSNAEVPTEYLVFDPEDNPHGIWASNTPAALNELHGSTLRLGSILGAIIDGSQEPLVLKLKKRFEERIRIAENNGFNERKTYKCDFLSKPLATAEEMRLQLVKTLKQYRRDYANEFTEAFVNGELKPIGFGPSQSLILAQGLTPGMICRFGDKEVVISAETLFNEGEFARVYTELTAGGEVSIGVCDVLSISPSEAHYKIINAIKVYNQTCRSEGTKPTTNGREEAAYKAFTTGWNTYLDDPLTVDEILGSIRPLGWGHNSLVTPEETPTTYARYLDRISGGKAGSVVSRKTPKTAGVLLTKGANRHLYEATEKATRYAFGKKNSEKYRLLRVFISPSSKQSGILGDNEEMFKSISDLSGSDANYYSQDSKGRNNGVGFVDDESSVGEAIEWACHTGNSLIVSRRVYDSKRKLFNNYKTRPQEIEFNGDDECVLVSPAVDNLVKNSEDSKGNYSVKAFNIDDIEGVLLDECHRYLIGDANVYTTEDWMQQLEQTDTAKYSPQEVTGGAVGRVETVGKKEAASLRSVLFEDGKPKPNSVWSKNGFSFASKRFSEENQEDLKYRIKDFLDSIIDGDDVDDDGFRRTNVGAGKILGLIKCTNLGGSSVIAPLMAPHNSPKKYDQCLIEVGRDGTIYVNYGANLTTIGKEEGQWFKLSIPDMVFKGMVVLVPEGVDLPTYRGVMQGTQSKIRLVTSWDTAKSRLPGRKVETMISDMWYFAMKEGFSFLYDTNGRVKKFISDQYRNNPEGLERLLRNDPNEWDAVGWGDIVLSEDPRANDFIASVVRNGNRKFNLAKLFSPGWDAPGVRSETNVRFYAMLQDMNEDLALKFFHGMDPRMCPNGLEDTTAAEMFFFNKDGQFKLFDNGYVYWDYVKWGPSEGIGAFSELHNKATQTGESNQAMVRLAMDVGYRGPAGQIAADYASAQAGDPSFYHDLLIQKMTQSRDEKVYASQSIMTELLAPDKYYWSPGEIRFERDIREIGQTFDPRNGRTVYHRGEDISNPFSSKIDGNPVVPVVGELQKLASDGMLSQEVILGLSMYQTGHTYNDGKGANTISLNHLAQSISTIVKNINKYGLPVVYQDLYIDEGRIPMPLLNREYARLLWDRIPALREHPDNRTNDEPDFEKFVARMKEEQGKTDGFITTMTQPQYVSKQQELRKLSEWCWRQWGEIGKSGYIYNGVFASDIINNDNVFCANAHKDEFDLNAISELSEQSAKLIADTRRMTDKRSRGKAAPDPNMDGRTIVGYPLDYTKPVHKFCEIATDTSRMMGLADVFIPISNIGFRAVAQTAMDAVMSMGNKLLPSMRSLAPNQKIVRHVAARDQETQVLWSVMRDDAVANNQEELFIFLENGGTIEEYLDSKEASAGDSKLAAKFKSLKDFMYKAASGFDAFMDRQFVNFVNRFAYFAAQDPALKQLWLTKDDSGFSNLDRILSQPGGGAKFLQEVFSYKPNNPSFLAAHQALESCRGADMAQKHILMEMFKHGTNNHPVPEFIVTTFLSRFPGYGLNITEEVLNFIIPMSTIRQTFISYAAARGHEKAAKAEETGGSYVDPHHETLLRNTNLRESLVVDMLHFGVTGVVLILSALPGAVEPPEDDDKWGNYKEWLLLGNRVGEAWWIEDILGVAGPVSCFRRSVDLGKPRLDLLVNGLANVCYSNPMLKVSDVVEFMIDPMSNLEEDYEFSKEKYAQYGGEFGFLDYINQTGASFGLSYISQFITPTFVKSVTNWATPYELDYKNIYEENVRGVLTDKGKAGEKLVKTSYEDASIRRLTRRNPVLALIMDLTHPGSTSYSGIDAIASISGKMAMPYTKYLDQYEYASMKTWSIEGLSDADAQAKVCEILFILSAYQDNLDPLVQQGFYLDTKTKAAVSAAIWDCYYQVEKEWNDFNKDASRSDYLILGEGDWDLGKERWGDLYGRYKDTKRYFNDLYYKTMKSEQLSRPLTEYMRYNTTYAQDDNGEWYATGFHPQGVLPIITAPGTIDNAEGTAGYENDFASVSEVTGKPLVGMRALVPSKDNEVVEWPGLKEWADDGAGNGFSKLYQQWYGGGSGSEASSNDDSSSSTKSKNTTNAKPGGSGSRGGGGGGGSRGGGGGGRGGSSAPNAYAPSVSLPKTNAGRIMNTDRLINPTYDYLRPDFETKGSRDAYRRSDI